MGEMNERIKIARTLAGVSQDDIASAVGVQRSVVVRYEQERRPTDGNLQKLAEFVGLPLEWFWGKSFKGIYSFRPEKPGQTHSAPAIRMKESALERDWPALIDALDLSNIHIALSTHGGAAIAYSSDVCIVVVGTHCIGTIRRISAGLDITVETSALDDTTFFNVWFQPELLYLKQLLNACGNKLESWADQVDEGEEGPGGTEWRVELTIQGYGSESDEWDADDANIKNEIKQALEAAGYHNSGIAVKRLTTMVEGTPEGWSFRERLPLL